MTRFFFLPPYENRPTCAFRALLRGELSSPDFASNQAALSPHPRKILQSFRGQLLLFGHDTIIRNPVTNVNSIKDLTIREGVTYNKSMKHKAPISVDALIGAVIPTAEAAESRISIIRLLAVDLKEIHSDVPFVQK